MFGSRKKDKISNQLLFSHNNMEEGRSRRIDVGVGCGLGEVEEAKVVKVDVEEDMWKRGRMREGHCCCGKKVADLEIYLFSATKQGRVGWCTTN